MRRTLLTLGVVTISGFLGTRALSQTPAASAQLALVSGSIYTSPTEQPIRDGAVLIDGGKIVSVGRRAAVRVLQGTIVIDTTGSTITAGFWNSHVHFLERMWADPAMVPASDLTRQFQMMLTQYGFTSVFDIWSSWENTRQLRERVESGEVAGPRIRATGPAMFPRAAGESAQMELSTTAGWASMGFMPQEKIQLTRVAETAEAVANAKRLLDLGADGIKLYVASGGRNGASMGDSAKLGRIAPGFIADLTVIRTDPTKDIRALSMIDYTIRDGKVVYRAPR